MTGLIASGGLSESIRKSSYVASDFNCCPSEAIVFWHYFANLRVAS
ncbi:hypothetical protein ES332_D07G031900v1 [Gossypium tomentosum]|uniref:Uncharacterized protein n=1 Tax=Gossypium tomentosum TaxID=34277 RepID=A0A5D2K3U2_GOSTO|nr:hypothetical protein ES332_D07G031900v1 [Gossypium tomentosum]